MLCRARSAAAGEVVEADVEVAEARPRRRLLRLPTKKAAANCKRNSESSSPEGGFPTGRGGGGGRGGLPPGRGPLAEPGTYTVTIAMGDKTDSKTVVIEQDPRIQVPSSDRDKRRQTIDTLITLTRDAEAARKKAVAIHNALVSLTDSWKQPNAPPIPDSDQEIR